MAVTYATIVTTRLSSGVPMSWSPCLPFLFYWRTYTGCQGASCKKFSVGGERWEDFCCRRMWDGCLKFNVYTSTLLVWAPDMLPWWKGLLPFVLDRWSQKMASLALACALFAKKRPTICMEIVILDLANLYFPSSRMNPLWPPHQGALRSVRWPHLVLSLMTPIGCCYCCCCYHYTTTLN